MKTITPTAEETLYLYPIPELTIAKERKPLLFLLTFAVLGIASLAVAYITRDSMESLSLLFSVLGFVSLMLLLWGAFNKKECSFYLQKENKIKALEYELDYSERAKIKPLMEKLQAEKGNVKFRNNQGKIKIDFLISKNKEFSACQFSQYVPYQYEAVSDIFYFCDKKSVAFVDQVFALELKS